MGDNVITMKNSRKKSDFKKTNREAKNGSNSLWYMNAWHPNEIFSLCVIAALHDCDNCISPLKQRLLYQNNINSTKLHQVSWGFHYLASSNYQRPNRMTWLFYLDLCIICIRNVFFISFSSDSLVFLHKIVFSIYFAGTKP